MLGVPAAKPSAASVGARLGMGEDIVQKLIAEIKGCCSWVVRKERERQRKRENESARARAREREKARARECIRNMERERLKRDKNASEPT